MSFDLDSVEEQSLSLLCKYLDMYIRKSITREGDGGSWLEMVLRCARISTLLPEFEDYFNMYVYNRGYRNRNDIYNPGIGMLKICQRIKEDEKVLNDFLNEIFEKLTYVEIEYENIEKIINCMTLLGYELEVEDGASGYGQKFTLTHLTEGEVERQKNISLMRTKLNNLWPEVLDHYDEALDTYSNANFSSCIVNCRTAFEKFFASFSITKNDYLSGILEVTGEQILVNGTKLTNRKKIFEYWLENKKGANRYRIMTTLYSAMSGLSAAHGEEVPSQADALMFLRMTEDIFIWYIQKSSR